MVKIIEKLEEIKSPDLSEAIEIYEKQARFCQKNPESSHLSVIYKIREMYSEKCNYLEIGTLFGFSMVNAIKSKTQGKFVGVDLFENTGVIAMNDYTPDVVERSLSIEKTKNLIELNNTHNHKVNLILGHSLDKKTYEQVVSICSEYDLIFIDGDHSYQGTLKDFKKYSPLVKVGGFVLLDDQDYGEIDRVIKKIRQEMSGEYRWIPYDKFSPKFSGFFQKISKGE